MSGIRVALFVLGVGFLVATLRILIQFLRYRRLRGAALVTWPVETPATYPWMLALGVVAGILVFVKLVVQQQPPQRAFGEGMMLIYYAYAVPLRLKIARGLYADGIWADADYIPYHHAGGHLPPAQPCSLPHRSARALCRGAKAAAGQDRHARYQFHRQGPRPWGRRSRPRLTRCAGVHAGIHCCSLAGLEAGGP